MSGLGRRAGKGPDSALGELSGSQTTEPDRTGALVGWEEGWQGQLLG